jgi:hypothetical protein
MFWLKDFHPNTVLLSLLTGIFADIYFRIRNLFLFDVISYLFSSHDILHSPCWTNLFTESILFISVTTFYVYNYTILLRQYSSLAD